MSRFLKEQLTNCLHNMQSNWICLSSYLNFITIVTNCYLCPKGFRKKKISAAFTFSREIQLITNSSAGSAMSDIYPLVPNIIVIIIPIIDRAPAVCPGTVQAASSVLTTLGLHCSLIKCDSWPSFSSGGERLGLALKCAVGAWHNWDLKQSWSSQCQSRCSRLSLKENTKH